MYKRQVDHRTGPATAVARAVTEVGSPAAVVVIAMCTAVLAAWRRRSVWPAVLILGTVVAAAGAGTVCKHIVGRARPPIPLHLTTESNFAFPSGHTTATTALVGAVLLVYSTTARSRSRTVVAAFAAVVPVAAVAASRLYLGVHWFTDVVGGVLLGAAVTLMAMTIVLIWQGWGSADIAPAEADRALAPARRSVVEVPGRTTGGDAVTRRIRR